MHHKRPALSLCLQVSLQDKDSKDIETIIEEIENFQKVRSEYIVKFYGAEVHHVSLGLYNTLTVEKGGEKTCGRK